MAMASTHIVGVAVLMSQFFLFATDSMAGLSGQDSIIRAGLSSLDTTAGLFFSCAIANLVLDPEHGQKYSLNRWRRNHSKITDRTTFMKISLRVKWHELQMKKRVATLHLLSDPEKHLPPSAKELFLVSSTQARTNGILHDLQFVDNLSQWIVPFMRDVPHSRQSCQRNWIQVVQLSMKTQYAAAARSIARYVCYVTYTLLFFLIRALMLSLHLRGWEATIIVLADLGRWLAAIFQEQSILTYSCQYKGILSWGSPPSGWAVPMSEGTKTELEKKVVEGLGRHSPAYFVFWVIKKSWPLMAKIPRWSLGSDIFSTFKTPNGDAFKPEESVTLLARIYEDDLVPQKYSYSVRFDNVPVFLGSEITNALTAQWFERYVMGIVLFLFSLLGILSPILLIVYPPITAFGRIYVAVETLAMNLSRYWDFSDLSINAKIINENGEEEWKSDSADADV